MINLMGKSEILKKRSLLLKVLIIRKTSKILSKSVLLSLMLFVISSIIEVNAYTLDNPTQSQNLGDLLNYILPFFFAIVGLTLFIMIIVSGYTWMTSGGSPEKLKKARGIMIAAVVGFIIIVLAGVLVSILEGFLQVKNKVNFSFLVSPVYAVGCAQGQNASDCLFGTNGINTQNYIINPSSNPDTVFNTITSSFINLAVSIAGAVDVIFIIFSGYKYITSAGDPQKASAGRKMLINALIGLVIILLSWGIVSLVTTIFGITLPSTPFSSGGGAPSSTPTPPPCVVGQPC